MFESLKIGRWFGIDVFVHPTFWLLPALVVFTSLLSGGIAQAGLDLAVVFAVFGCVALHEYGHALAARGYGIATRDITLYPIGGVARLEGMPDRPWPEIVVALAGPAVNVVIAGVLGVVLAVGGAAFAPTLTAAPSVEAFLSRLLVANVFLVAFNLLPAFPMDGGRVFRAVVNWLTDRVTATEVAAGLGAVLAGLMALVGLGVFEGVIGLGTSPMLVVLAAFVFLAGRGELAAVRYQDEHRWAVRRAAARIPVVHPVEPEPMAGWEWDPVTRVWTEWRDGFPVRRFRA